MHPVHSRLASSSASPGAAEQGEGSPSLSSGASPGARPSSSDASPAGSSTSGNFGVVVLLSGGLDSATTLYLARSRGYRIHALSFSYGQRHSIELESARKVAAAAGVEEHRIISLDTSVFRNSALVEDMEMPMDRDEATMASEIPVTYVPGRNILFLSFALSYCESRDLRRIFIGANAVDYSGYPDCRPEFIQSFQEMAALGTRAGVEGRPVQIEAPLIALKKSQIIQLGLELGLDYSLTSSCYQPDDRGHPCGHCDSCRLRAMGFEQAGLADPLTA